MTKPVYPDSDSYYWRTLVSRPDFGYSETFSRMLPIVRDNLKEVWFRHPDGSITIEAVT